MNDLQPTCSPIKLRFGERVTTTRPTVTVVLFSYNHELFIRKCLDSVLDQCCSFPVEVIIHDDASTDGTASIIREYAARFPTVFTPILREENGYSKSLPIFQAVIGMASGVYVAVCECDDYWLSTDKLSKQVAMLDKYPDCAYCSHRFLHVGKDETGPSFPSQEESEFGTLEDLLVRNYTHTCTLMFRKDLAIYPSDWRPVHSGDWYLCSLLARNGKIAFINEVMSAYRLHSGGVCTGMPLEQKLQTFIVSLAEIHRMLGGGYKACRKQAIINYRIHIAQNYLIRGLRTDVFKSIATLSMAFLSNPRHVARRKDSRCILHKSSVLMTDEIKKIACKFKRIRFHLGALLRKFLVCCR